MREKNTLWIKILVPALIVAAVAGIFLIKKLDRGTPAPPPGAQDGRPLEVELIDLEEFLSHGLPVMIDFGAAECGPCQAMAAALANVHAQVQGKAVVHYIDVWKNPEGGVQDFPVRVIPTQVFYMADGKPYVPAEGMGIPFTLYSDKDSGEHRFTVHEGGLTEEQMLAVLADMGVTRE